MVTDPVDPCSRKLVLAHVFALLILLLGLYPDAILEFTQAAENWAGHFFLHSALSTGDYTLQ